MTLERGAVLHNRYRIIEILGQGGMGSIYRSIDNNLGVEVAVKENLFTTEEFARQFRREAVILASLKHPNLPRVSDHFVISEQGQYLVMDYIEGEDLRERMDRVSMISEDDAIVIGIAICDAMAYMHSQNPPVLHRDIKPGNVRIAPNGHIYLVDFGLAKIVQDGQQTSTGARAMTPGYSPPEQYGAARTDHRSDIFSLGATLYASLTGTIPEDSLARTMEQLELTPLRKRNPKVSRRLANAIEKALAVHPDDRYQSAVEFQQALQNARGVTLRRFTEKSTPYPSTIMVDNLILNESNSHNSKPAVVSPAENHHSDLPLPVSSTIPANGILDNSQQSEPTRRKPHRSSRRSCLVSIVIVLFILIIAGVVSFRQDQVLFSSRIFDSIPQLGTVFSTLKPDTSEYVSSLSTATIVTATENVTIETAIPSVQMEIEIDTPAPTNALEPSATATMPPTETETIVPTLEPSSTPMGGGYGQVAFTSDRTGIPQIWKMNIDGTGLTQITETQQGACQPSWSPNGNQIVFISPCDTHREVYTGSSLFIINEDGTGLTPLPIIGGGDYDPAWSPDGEFILFTSLREGGIPQIYLMNISDRSAKLISDTDERRGMQASWSIDGQEIIFISSRNGPYQIWTMNMDGSSPARFSVSGGKKNEYPVWSPDQQMVVFTQSETEGAIPRLYAARYPDGALNETRVYPFAGNIPMRRVDFSPDGIWLVLESWPDGINHDIFIMTPNGAERTQLTFDPAMDYDPVWRPSLP
jgi:serine/threonine protein kinase